MTPAVRAQYLAQLKRDLETLREEPFLHAPSRAFFERRVRKFRKDLRDEDQAKVR